MVNSNFVTQRGTTYTVLVGAGAAAPNNSPYPAPGSNSSIVNTITAYGGGSSPYHTYYTNGLSGGSGSGGLAWNVTTGDNVTGGAGIQGQGNAGGSGWSVTSQGGGGGSGGGGASGNSNTNGGAQGGSGVVILQIPTTYYSGNTTGSPTVSAFIDYTYLIYKSSGTYTA